MQEKLTKKSGGRTLLIIIIVMTVLTVICGVTVFRLYLKRFTQEHAGTKYDQYYVMITGDENSAFSSAVYEGVMEAGQEHNIYIDMLGEHFSSDYAREDLMRIAIASDVDGIIVTADESPVLSELINEAADSGIPVVTLYGDNTQSRRCSFVGVGGYNIGKEYGEQVLSLVREHPDLTTVKVAVLVNANALDSAQNIICSGIQETFDKTERIGKKIEMTLVSVDATNPFSAEEAIRDILMKEEIPDAIICLNELHTTCVYQAVVDYNKVGDVAILGYYDSDTIIKGIERGVIRATIAVDAKQMGSYCIDALREYNEFGYTSQYFTADITLIDKKNVAAYRKGGE